MLRAERRHGRTVAFQLYRRVAVAVSKRKRRLVGSAAGLSTLLAERCHGRTAAFQLYRWVAAAVSE